MSDEKEEVQEVKETKKVKEEPVYQVVEVPTQYGVAIQTPEGSLMTDQQALVHILNEVKGIKKVIG